MNKDQQKTVNEMLDAMELDTYGEKGLKEIIRQLVVEMVKQSAPPKRELSDEEIADLWWNNYVGTADSVRNFARVIEKAHGIGGKE
jgi:hypothetical protein